MNEQERQELLARLPDDPVNAERPIESLQQRADRLAASIQPCAGFPADCPNLVEVEPNLPQHGGGVRCGCQDLDPLKDALKAAFRRGYDRGVENTKKSTAEHIAHLEAEVAELRQDRDPESLRARIADLQYVTRGYSRLHTGGSDLRRELADALGRLDAAQKELAVLKGVQPSNATGERPS